MAQQVKISDHGRGTILTYEWVSQEIDSNRDHIVGRLHDNAGFRGEVKLYRVHYGKTYDQMAPGGTAAYIIAALLSRRYTEAHGHNAVVCGGCGMDIGFDLVYNLSARLYGDGYKIRQEWI